MSADEEEDDAQRPRGSKGGYGPGCILVRTILLHFESRGENAMMRVPVVILTSFCPAQGGGSGRRTRLWIVRLQHQGVQSDQCAGTS